MSPPPLAPSRPEGARVTSLCSTLNRRARLFRKTTHDGNGATQTDAARLFGAPAVSLLAA
jgi:hypothetical protein